MTRVAVIGAGPSGLSQLRAFQTEAQKGAKIPDIVCYEKQDDWGGLWNYTWRTGLDEYGEPVHCSMYRYLWSNLPTEGLEFPDYTFEEHFGKPIPSYLPRPMILDYITGHAKKSDVRKWIRFRTPIRRVTYDADTGMFSVTAHGWANDEEYTEKFDQVVVATGHYSTPNAPDFDGMQTFNGRVLHSHDLREFHEFKDRDVLIVGASFSGEDIASHCLKFGCKSVTISYRKEPLGSYKWPENVKEVALLKKVEKNTCTLEDGSTVDVDAIILCTGYKHHFPFMAKELKLKTDNRFAPASLYKGVVFADNPKLFYLGMQNQIYTFSMFDAQAWYVRDVIMGRIRVPDREARMADVEDRVAREDAGVKKLSDAVCYQADYIKELIADTDYPKFDVDATKALFFECIKHKDDKILGFRDHCLKSAMSGKMSRLHHKLWKDKLGDSDSD